MKSPESTMSKSSVKRKFQEKKIRASRSANQSMKSPEPKNVKNTLKKPHQDEEEDDDEEDDDLMKDTAECPSF